MKKIVCIEWIDATIEVNNEQLSYEEACKSNLIHGFACGVLVNEDKQKITIARDWFDDNNEFRGIATYPKSGIKKIKRFDAFGEIEP